MEEALDHLHSALSAQAQPVAITQPQAISGLGGVGKTQLAVEYAYRYRDNYQAVLWARAESADLLVSDYLTIAALLELPEHTEPEQRKIVNAVLRWFDTHEGWLLILDNADHLEVARDFIPSSANGHVILTTRAFSTGTIAGRIELNTMMIEEGILFLLRRIKRIRGITSLDGIPGSVWNQARAIVEALDALPLALDQAGAYIEEMGSSLSDYLKLYRARRQRLLRMRGQDAAGHPEPVATTWSLSVEKIKQANPAAAELLHLLALLHPDRIPESIIVAGAPVLGSVLQPVANDEFDFNEALGELHKYSLIKRDPEEKILAIHRLVQAVIWDGIGEQEREQWMQRAVSALDTVFPDISPDTPHKVWEQCEHLLPHVLTCVTAVAPQSQSLELASLLYKTATYLFERAQYEQAESLFQRVLRIQEQILGPDDLQFANSLSQLADLYREQGKYEQAEPLFQRTLHIQEQTLGPDHAQLGKPLNSLGILYAEQGKYVQAEPLFQRALHIRVQTLGLQHPRAAYPLNNLGDVYQEQGKYEQAEPLYWQALHIWEQALEPEHPLVAHPLEGLANLYLKQGKYEQTEPLFQRALQIREQALGHEHPYVAHPLNGLANLYRGQGKYKQAEPLYQRARSIRQSQRGAQHPETAESLHDFAHLHELRKQPEEALALYLQALAIREQQLGPQHPYTIDTRTRATQLLRESGRIEEAVELENFPEQEAMTSDQPAK